MTKTENGKPFFGREQYASKPQKARLKFEALSCAIVLAPLRDIFVKVDGDVYHCDEMRPWLRRWFDERKLPENLKQYFINTWVLKTADEILLTGGYKTHETETMFYNLKVDECDFLIRRFVGIRHSLARPITDIQKVKKFQNDLKEAQ